VELALKDSLTQALKSEAAFPVSDYFTVQGSKLATNRMVRIRNNWKFYLGDHERFDNTRKSGAQNILYNYVRCVVDKSVRWLANPPWRIVSAPGNERLAEFYETIWAKNQKRLLFRDIAIQGAVSGDAFVWVGVTEERGEGGKLVKKLRLKVLNSTNTHPVIDPDDPTRMLYCVVQYPIYLGQGRQYRGQVVADPLDRRDNMALYTAIITPNQVYEYINDSLVEEKLGVGFVPIAHIPNLMMGGASFGRDEVNDLKQINLSINSVATDLKEIVNYYASPITVAYGVTMGDVARGAGMIWSGLPSPQEARIESLEQKADLNGSLAVLDGLVQQMHELSNIPRGSLASDQAITNVSEAALRVFFMPLLEVLEEKYDTYGEGVNRINKMVARVIRREFKIDVASLVGAEVNPVLALETRGEFMSPIPKDTRELMQAVSEKLQNKLISRADALRKLGEAHPEYAAMEILSDMAEDLFLSYQRGRASMGIPVSFSALALGSLGKMSGAKKELAEIENLVQTSDRTESLVDLHQRQMVQAEVSPDQPSEPSDPDNLAPATPNRDMAGKIADSLQQIEEVLDTSTLADAERQKILTLIRQRIEES